MAEALIPHGSLDWVSLSKSSVNFSIELLSRYSGAGVEALTVAISQALFAQFNLPIEGQKRLQDSLSKLKAFSSFGDVLWFGFGVKHPTRTLAETEAGACCVAMCACMMVSYDREYCATVLKMLCGMSSMPDNLVPALSQWAAMADLCAGAVTASKFPVLVEGFCRLFGGVGLKTAATKPDSLAMGLQELGRVSSGSVQSVTFVGDVDCAWLAALAEWLFSLRVCITDAQGNWLYRSQRNDAESVNYYQVTFIRLDHGQTYIPQIQVQRRTFLIPPGERAFNFRSTDYHGFFRGSSEWSTILTDTFGKRIQDLLDATVLPSFAKFLYMAIGNIKTVPRQAITDTSIYPHLWADLMFWNDSGDCRQRFQAMMSFIAARLPELGHLARFGITNATELENDFQLWIESREDLHHDYYGFRALYKRCACYNCRDKMNRPDKKSSHSMCLVELTTTILHYVVILSWLDVEDSLRPSPVGLMYLANSCKPLNLETTFTRESYIRRSRDYVKSYPYRRPIVSTLFNGVEIPVSDLAENSAFSDSGVCVYMPMLEHQELSVENQLRLRVVPGQIERNSKLYKRVSDRPVKLSVLDERTTDAHINEASRLGSQPLLQILVEETVDSSYLNAEIVAIPNANALNRWNSASNVRKKVGSDAEHIVHDMYCGPGRLMRMLCSNVSISHCISPCEVKETECSWAPQHIEHTWSHRCSLTEMPWWTHNPGPQKTSLGFTNPSEWVLATYSNRESWIEFFRGSVNILYFLLSRFSAEYSNDSLYKYCLVKPNDCVMCALKPHNIFKDALSLFIHSFVEGQIETTEISINHERTRGHYLEIGDDS